MAKTPAEWFAMLHDIERDLALADAEHRKIENIKAADRAFIRRMANELSAREDAMPTPGQAQWLQAIRQWIDAGKK